MLAINSLLFVPGSRPERFEKARAGGAGLTVIDLEDAVAPGDKETARKAAFEAIAHDAAGYALRINPLDTAFGIEDIAALLGAKTRPETILLPMVEEARDVEIVAHVLGDACPTVIPLIETPRGLRHALEIARVERVGAVMFGGGDFASELGVKLGWEPLLAARQALILACAEACKPAIDVPFIHLDDAQGLADECARAKALGFGAKAAIHPRQVATIEDAFVPSESEVNEAKEALQAYEQGGERAIRHKGRMLEAPMVKNYRAVVARSRGNADA